MEKAKKICFWIISVILGCIILVNVYTFISVKVFKQPLASVFGRATLEVISGSMEPVIKKGDIILVSTNVKELYKYDIITFIDENGSLVTHRILEIEGDKILTKGDNNNTNDGLIDKDAVIAKYIKKYNGAGFLLNSIKSPFVIVMIFVIGILACVFLSLDKTGEPILDENEKEFAEFKKFKKESAKNNLKKKEVKSVKISNKTKDESKNIPNTINKKEANVKVTKDKKVKKASVVKPDKKIEEKVVKKTSVKTTPKTSEIKPVSTKKSTTTKTATKNNKVAEKKEPVKKVAVKKSTTPKKVSVEKKTAIKTTGTKKTSTAKKTSSTKTK